MSQRTMTRRVCDVHRDRDAQPYPLTVKAIPYPLDLCPECAEDVATALAPFLRALSDDSVAPKRTRTVRPPRVVPALVREWGAKNGVEVAPKGPISRAIEDLYLADQQ